MIGQSPTLWGGQGECVGRKSVFVSMDVILKVIEGAKEGTKVAIKKDRFLIGRSPKCHLCAGSTAISRKHCAILRSEAKVSLQDLGSRNGTLVNGKKITDEVELASGDEIAVGPLKFLVTITHGISNAKKPQVKTVADAVERTVEKSDSGVQDDDITSWLLESNPASKSVAETQTIEMDDTSAGRMEKLAQDLADDDTSAGVVAQESDAGELAEEEESTLERDEKDNKKKGPGKLPPISTEPDTKDSGEAAAEALRSWNRRR